MKITFSWVWIALVISACSSTGVRKQAVSGEEEYPVRVIDAHTHTLFTGQAEPSSHIIVTEENYLREMKENHVVGAITHNADTSKGYFNSPQNHVMNCVGIRIPTKANLVEQGLKSKKYGCIKIYLGYVHAYAADAAYRPIYRLAEKYHVPVVFHTGDTYSTKGKLKYSDPLTVDEVAVDFPNVNFVIAHLGNPWIQSAAEVAYKNPNVYLDGSALLIGQLKDYSPEELEKYVIEPIRFTLGYVESSKKLMYGTDWPLVGMKDYITAFKRAIPKEQWDDVFYKNARRIFQMNDLPE
jgi:hypothetical protein